MKETLLYRHDDLPYVFANAVEWWKESTQIENQFYEKSRSVVCCLLPCHFDLRFFITRSRPPFFKMLTENKSQSYEGISALMIRYHNFLLLAGIACIRNIISIVLEKAESLIILSESCIRRKSTDTWLLLNKRMCSLPFSFSNVSCWIQISKCLSHQFNGAVDPL